MAVSEFKGVVPALITPMTAAGALNEEALRRVIEFNIEAGGHGFWGAGGTGGSILLSDEENRRIAEIAADQNKGRIKNIMHVGAPTTERAVALARHAAAVGVEAICCVPPFFYRRTDEEIVEHYRAVADAAGLPLFVYNLPSATRVEITPALMEKIQRAVPMAVGLKHSAENQMPVRTFARMGLACFSGNGRLMLPALTIGAIGCVDGPPCVAPELWMEVWNAHEQGDLRRAEKAQEQVWLFVDAMLACGGTYHALAKAALSLRLGIDCGAARLPAAPLTEQERAALVQLAGQWGW
ncbi:MAG: dihydrodipicolinate synthase family protein [Candidatus Latescibacterota bacterium]